jgi:RNA polymerase sigma factor (SigM family)
MEREGERLDRKRKAQLEDIYRQYAEGLYYYLLRLSGSSSIAEELVQETFYRATISLSFYKNEEVRGWLFRVARNAYLDEWRKRQRWKWVPFFEKEQIQSPYGLPEEEAVSKENTEELSDLLNLLPENYRTILYLREFAEFTYEELQETLEMSEAQVKVTLHRARKRLEQLGKKGMNVND